jgi:AsmA protein
VNPIAFEFEGKPFVITAQLSNFSNLNYQVLATGLLDLGKINQVFGDSSTQVNGTLEANLKLKGTQADAMAANYQKLNNSGKLIFNNISISTPIYPLPFVIHNGIFSFDQDQVNFSKFNATYGDSDFQLAGSLNGITGYALEQKPLQGQFKLTSKHLFVDSFMAFSSNDTTKAAETTSQGVVILPQNLAIRFETKAEKIFYNDLIIKDFTGGLLLKNQVLLLEQTNFNLIDCAISMDATYGSIDPLHAYFQYHIKATGFDIQKAYQQIKLFRDMATSAKRVKGVVSIDYEIKGNLNQAMMPIYPSLEGGGTFTLEKVKVAGLGLFTQLSKSTERQDLKDPDLKKVEIKSSIKNNIISIEPVKMRIAGFRPKFSGTTSFDGNMKLKFRLGLPPLGIFGINMRVLGTMDNPIIKYGKGGDEADLTETEYQDKLSEDLLKRIKDAKEENASGSDPE